MVQDESLPGLRVARGADRLVITELEVEAGGRNDVTFVTAHGQPQLARRPSICRAGAIDGDPKTGWGISALQRNHQGRSWRCGSRSRCDTSADSVITVRIRQDSDLRRATMGRFRLALSPSELSWPTADKGKEIPDAVLRALRMPEDKRTDAQKTAIANASSSGLRRKSQPASRRKWPSWSRHAALVETAIPRVVVSEATDAGRNAHSGARQLDGRIGRDRAARRPRLPRQARHRRPPRHAARSGQLAGLARKSADRARLRQPPLAPVLRHRDFRSRWTISARRANGRRIPNCSTGWPPNSCIPQCQAEGAHAWDVKHLIRTIVTSQTYRQSSMSTPELDERDPDNRLLARQSRFRVDAEVVRDIALSVSGLLVEKFGGPSVKPYQPDGYLATLNFPKREYAASRGDDLYRRGVYTFWQRTFLHPSLLTFDAPTREECTVNRVNSNTPLQALVLLNDPIYVEAARVFAQNILQHGREFERTRRLGLSSAPSSAHAARRRSAPLAHALSQEPGAVPALARRCPCS